MAGLLQQIAPLTGAGVLQRAAHRIDRGEHERDEARAVGVAGQDAVGASENLARVVVDLDQRAETGSRFGHQQGGSHAVAGHVADGHGQPAVAQGDVVEVIAGGLLGRIKGRSDVETVQLRRRGRKEPLLDLLRGAKFLGRVAELVFGPVPAPSFQRVTDGSDQQVVVELALDQVVLGAGLNGADA